jgi:hypothetical protein
MIPGCAKLYPSFRRILGQSMESAGGRHFRLTDCGYVLQLAAESFVLYGKKELFPPAYPG